MRSRPQVTVASTRLPGPGRHDVLPALLLHVGHLGVGRDLARGALVHRGREAGERVAERADAAQLREARGEPLCFLRRARARLEDDDVAVRDRVLHFHHTAQRGGSGAVEGCGRCRGAGREGEDEQEQRQPLARRSRRRQARYGARVGEGHVLPPS